jgi:hypothetical protein
MSPTVVFRTTLPDVAGCKTVDMGNSATYNYRYFEPKARSFGVFQVRGLPRSGLVLLQPKLQATVATATILWIHCDDQKNKLKISSRYRVNWSRNVTKIIHQKVVKD